MTNNSNGCTYRFIESSVSLLSNKAEYDVEIRQQPIRAKVSLINERDRRPIEPPPILQLNWKNCTEEEIKLSLQSPFYFVIANIVTEKDTNTPLPTQDYLSGSTVSSLHRLRDVDNSDGGFFVFGDLAVKKEGKFKLRFSLFEIVDGQVENRKTLLSDTFTVFIPKKFPGPIEPTFLSRTFSDQGVKMRVRKEHRLQSRKRKSIENQLKSEKSIRKVKRSKLKLSSPSYAETHSSSDVLFARWQPSLLDNKIFIHSNEDTPCKYYSSSSSTTSDSTIHPSPPPLLPHDPYFVKKYHTYSDRKPNLYPLPTPPRSMADLHQHATGTTTWGHCLPPLRAIMNEYDYHPTYPLLLPPLSTLHPSF